MAELGRGVGWWKYQSVGKKSQKVDRMSYRVCAVGSSGGVVYAAYARWAVFPSQDPLQATGALLGLGGDLATSGRLCWSQCVPARLSTLLQQGGKLQTELLDLVLLFCASQQ